MLYSHQNSLGYLHFIFKCFLTFWKNSTNVLLEKSWENSSHFGSCQLGLIFAVGTILVKTVDSGNAKNLWAGTMASGGKPQDVHPSVNSLKWWE